MTAFKVLITREINASSTTARAIKALGFESILHPLIEIEPIHYTLPGDFAHDYVIITSINAAKLVLDEPSLSQSPFLVVGEKSAECLRDNGFNVEAVYPDSSSLLADVSKHTKRLNLLYLSGDYIATDITINHHNTRRIIVYKSKKVERFDLGILNDIDIATFYSPRAARIFHEHVCGQHKSLERITAVCLSPNIADALGELPFKSIKIAKTPKEGSLLEALKMERYK